MAVYYATATELRTELDVTALILTDAAAEKLIADAEDLVDTMLGGWEPDTTTGRKITQTDVETWQWAKLKRATVKVAANLHRNPGVLSSAQWDEVKGPDFWFVGRIGGPLAAIATPIVLALLDDSGLRRLAGRARSGPYRRRSEFDRFLRATRHNGT